MKAFIEWLRGTSAILGWIIASPFQNLHLMLTAKDEKHAQALFQRRSERLLRRCRFKVVLRGDPPPTDGGYIFVYNETSIADLIAFTAFIWPYVDRAAAAEVFMRLPFGKATCKKLGIYVVMRGQRAKTDIILSSMVADVKSGLSVAWGGEGALAGFDGVGRFKVGSSLIAIRSGAPIIPVCFKGGHQAMTLGSLRARPGTIEVSFGEPISPKGYTEDDARKLTDRVQAAVAQLYAKV